MSGQAQKVYAVANAEVGYHEGRTTAGAWNNIQKYSPAVPTLEWSQGQAWCQTFQSWIFQQAGLKALAPVTASTATAYQWYNAKNRSSFYPAVGAMVFFGPAAGSHVGFVYKYDADNIYTIEGNTNADGATEGNGVYLKMRARRDSYVYGYGYPAYTEGIVTADPAHPVEGSTYSVTATLVPAPVVVPKPVPVPAPVVPAPVVVPPVSTLPKVTMEKVQVGLTNNDIKLVQAALAKVMIGDTGNFSKTMRAVYALYQQSLGFTGIDALGDPGPQSLAKLGFNVVSAAPAPTPVPVKLTPADVTFNRYTAGGIVDDWIAAACKAAGVPANAAWLTGYKTAISRESSGDPNAINLNDANAINPPGFFSVKDYGNATVFGTPLGGKLTPFQCSRGVAQCIPQTFAEFHVAGTSNNIYDPVANIAASIKYVQATYNVSTDGSNLASKVQQFDPNRPPKGY